MLQVTINAACWVLLFYFVGKSLYEYFERPIVTTLINDPIRPSGTPYRPSMILYIPRVLSVTIIDPILPSGTPCTSTTIPTGPSGTPYRPSMVLYVPYVLSVNYK
jgi:hypothetical protein